MHNLKEHEMIYRKLEKLGSGSYGSVYKGKHKKHGYIVAMKQVEMNLFNNGFPQSYLREVSLLKTLRHENIVHFIDIIWNDCVYLIFEYMESDLFNYINECEPNGIRLSALQSYFYQIVNGVEFCHEHGALHRDLKPENILIDSHGVVKIADFGLSRSISVPVRNYTTVVVTLWYRAPELLLGVKSYACSIDIWALGCIFAEMATGVALFIGDSEIDQLQKIFSIMGSPDEDTWPGVTELRFYKDSSFQNHLELGLSKKVLIRGSGFDLLQQMLIYNPDKRISAKQMLKHPYFSGFNPYKRYHPLPKLPKRLNKINEKPKAS